MIVKEYLTGPLQVNTYAILDEDSKEAFLIDVGGSFEEIYSEIKMLGYSVKFVLNTHGHFDHIMANGEIQEKYPNLPIYISKNDLFHCENLKDIMAEWGVYADIKDFKAKNFIDENSELFIGNKKIQIIETPGHSKGGLCFYIDNILFSGDTLFWLSIGRTDFPDGNYDELISSIKTKLLILPEDTKVYPGHGGSTTIKQEKNRNSYLV